MKKRLALFLLLFCSIHNFHGSSYSEGFTLENGLRVMFLYTYINLYMHAAKYFSGGVEPFHDSIDTILGGISVAAFTELLFSTNNDLEDAMKKVMIGTSCVALHAFKIYHTRIKAAELQAALKRKADRVEYNKNIKKVTDEDLCCLCLDSFKNLRKANKIVMQGRCCGKIFCEDELLEYMRVNRNSIEQNENVRCFACTNKPFYVQNVDQTKPSVMHVE